MFSHRITKESNYLDAGAFCCQRKTSSRAHQLAAILYRAAQAIPSRPVPLPGEKRVVATRVFRSITATWSSPATATKACWPEGSNNPFRYWWPAGSASLPFSPPASDDGTPVEGRRATKAHAGILESLRLLYRSLALAALAALGPGVPSARTDIAPLERRLRFYHTHTREHLDIVYWRDHAYIPEALASLDHFLRDHRTGDVHHYDPRVFDLLTDLTWSVGQPGAEINVICGYRTPRSNEYLRTHTSGVARDSLHTKSEAIDIRLPGLNTAKFRDAALALGRGGVGYYPASDFIHVDVGRVRRW